MSNINTRRATNTPVPWVLPRVFHSINSKRADGKLSVRPPPFQKLATYFYARRAPFFFQIRYNDAELRTQLTVVPSQLMPTNANY